MGNLHLRSGERYRYVMVVAIEFDSEGDLALTEAMELARHREGCELHVVHVVHDVGMARQPQALDEASQQLRQVMDERIVAMSGPAQLSISLHIRLGEPAHCVAQLAADVDADLIIVGVHERKAVKRLFTPSVTADLMNKGHCPLLLIKLKSHAERDRSPSIQPPCPECLRTQQQTDGAQWWCEMHASKHAYGHSYTYHRDISLRTHDSSFIPTGIEPGRIH